MNPAATVILGVAVALLIFLTLTGCGSAGAEQQTEPEPKQCVPERPPQCPVPVKHER